MSARVLSVRRSGRDRSGCFARSTRSQCSPGATSTSTGSTSTGGAPAHPDLQFRLSELVDADVQNFDRIISFDPLSAAAAGERLEFVTADLHQSRMVHTEVKARRLDVRLIVLPA